MADNIEFLVTAQNATKSAFSEVRDDLDGLVVGLGRVVTASAAVVAAAAAVAIHFGDMADELDNNSTLLNINAQTLSDWQNVAIGANISGDAFVGMLEKLSKNAGDAATGGNKQLIESFAAIGISQADLQGRLSNLNELFPAVLEGVRSLGVGYDQVTRTVELFGRGSVGLVNIARESKAAFDEQVETHRRLACVLSNEEVKAIADAKDKWDQFLDSLEHRGLIVFGQVIDKLTEMGHAAGRELSLLDLNAQIKHLQDTLNPQIPEQSFVDALINGKRGGSGELAGVLPEAKARLEAQLKALIEVRDLILNEAANKPAAPDTGGGSGGAGGDPALAGKIAAAQAAAAELLAIGQLDSVGQQVKTEFDLANAQREADERVRILQGWAIVDKSIKDQQLKLDKQRDREKVLSATASALGMLASATQGNKKLFEVSKAAAIAGAIVSTYQAAANALAQVPYPYNFVAAAIVTAAGLANVAQIASTQFGSTAAATSSAGPGGFTAGGPGQPGQLAAPSVAVAATDQQQGTIRLVIDTGGDEVVDTIMRNSRAFFERDGVAIPAGSRQAMELAS